MICKKCGNDKFDVINVFRNKRRINGKWIINENYDTRLLICQDCGRRIFTETTEVSEIIFNESKFKVYEKDKKGNLYLFYEGD